MMLADRNRPASGAVVTRGGAFQTLSGLTGCDNYEWIPPLENSQDYLALARAIESRLMRCRRCHGLLLRARELYAWGADIAEACRHVEALEALSAIVMKSRD